MASFAQKPIKTKVKCTLGRICEHSDSRLRAGVPDQLKNLVAEKGSVKLRVMRFLGRNLANSGFGLNILEAAITIKTLTIAIDSFCPAQPRGCETRNSITLATANYIIVSSRPGMEIPRRTTRRVPFHSLLIDLRPLP